MYYLDAEGKRVYTLKVIIDWNIKLYDIMYTLSYINLSKCFFLYYHHPVHITYFVTLYFIPRFPHLSFHA